MEFTGQQTQFYIDIVYGVLFAGGFGILLFGGLDVRIAAFQGGLVLGYFLRVWERMSVYERILREEVAAEAHDAVTSEIDQHVPDEAQEAVADEAAEAVAREVAAELDEQVEPEVTAEVERQVAEEMAAEIKERVTEEVTKQVDREIEERIAEIASRDGGAGE